MSDMAQVEYKHWDCLRGFLYDAFEWYIENETLLQRVEDITGDTPDVTAFTILRNGTQKMEKLCEGVKRGDEL